MVDVALNEGGARGEADLVGQRARRLDPLAGEVDAGDDGPAPCPAQSVETEVALQVQQGGALGTSGPSSLESRWLMQRASCPP